MRVLVPAMGSVNTPLLAFNRGVIAPQALARVDLDRMPFSAEAQRNWLPSRLGSMSLRPGWQYLGGTENNETTYNIDFIFSRTDAVIIQFTSTKIRFWVNDALVTNTDGSIKELTHTYGSHIHGLSYVQSANVIYLACPHHKPKQLNRWLSDNKLWELEDYDNQDGPFGLINTTATTITPSGLTGNVTLTASSSLFSQEQVGALFRLESSGQTVSDSVAAENTFTDDIRITGVGSSRGFAVTVSGSFSGTVTLQRSITAPGDWTDVETYTGGISKTFNDGLDNQIVHYRIGIKSGQYTSGTASLQLTFGGGSAVGVARITAYTSATSVSAEVLDSLGSTGATDLWYEGMWSDKKGYPSAVALYGGRLWWAGKQYWYGSVSDDYTSFNPDTEGASGPIIRQIGYGPVDSIEWLIPLERLLAGTAGGVVSARSTSFDEPLTPTNFQMKTPDSQGCDASDAVVIDDRGIYIHGSQQRVMELRFDYTKMAYTSVDLTALIPGVLKAGVKRLLVQRQPDTRVHAIMNDGKVWVLVTDPVEEVLCWIEIDTDGEVEDGIVLPGTGEDNVYYTVKRGTSRCFEKWALETECENGTINKSQDSFITFANTQTVNTSHIPDGTEVVAWADGKDIEKFTVASGQVDLGKTYTTGSLGLYYDSWHKSSKLAYAAQQGTALTQSKRVSSLGLILHKTHAQGIQYGTDPNNLYNLPLTEGGQDVDPDKIWEHYDAEAFPAGSQWDSDTRLYLKAAAPRSATVLAAMLRVETNG